MFELRSRATFSESFAVAYAQQENLRKQGSRGGAGQRLLLVHLVHGYAGFGE
jgi:hypothetical protein